jgi:hypothetical protein
MLRLLALFVVACISYNTYAAELIKDYLINSQVYTWYGQLDASQQWREQYPNAKVDLKEYAQARPQGLSQAQSQVHWQAGAHHILDISLLPGSTPLLTQVRVTAEFYPQANNDEAVRGYYLQQLLSFEPQHHSSSPSLNLSLSKVETELIEQDDFSSRFIASSDTNVVRGFLYRWTQGLDEPDSDNLSLWLSPEAKLALAEAQITSIVDYQAYLAGLGLIQSRRSIKNLQIQPVGEEKAISAEQDGIAGKHSRVEYRVEFEYQWSALNGEGETEMANIGVVIYLHVRQGKVSVLEYREQYLAPKTDLGAEIRC